MYAKGLNWKIAGIDQTSVEVKVDHRLWEQPSNPYHAYNLN
jgi:hypothetical protein